MDGRFVMRSFSAIRGAAACATASAPSIWKCSSGIDGLSYIHASGLQVGKELMNLFPDFGSTREPAPVHANQSNQTITLINRNDEILCRRSDAVDQEGLNIWLHLLQGKMLRSDLRPGPEA